MKNRPYIGVTGFTERNEVLRCLEWVPENAERLFMVGVLLSSKTISGGVNKYPVRYPHYKNIEDIFVNDNRCLNMIHYTTDDKSTLAKQLLDAAEIGGENCHGFQLNIVWPDIEMLKEVKKELPNYKFVIQCSGSAMRRFDNVSESTVPRLLKSVIDSYRDAGVIDYLLIDPSGGRGMSFNSETAFNMLTPHKNQEDYCIGVAGGLRASTISNLHSVLCKLPYLFWDAESGLRDKGDNLLVGEAIQYLEDSFNLDALLNAKDKYKNENTIY